MSVNMTRKTIEGVSSPEDLTAILKATAQQYREDAQELRSAWQDPEAGSIWDYASRVLEEAADAIENQWWRT